MTVPAGPGTADAVGVGSSATVFACRTHAVFGGHCAGRAERYGSGGVGRVAHLEAAGDVNFADAVSQGESEGWPALGDEGVQPNWQVGAVEEQCGDVGRRGEGRVRVPDQAPDTGRFVGSGEVGQDAQRSWDAGGDAGGGGDGSVLNELFPGNPVQVRVLLPSAPSRDQWRWRRVRRLAQPRPGPRRRCTR